MSFILCNRLYFYQNNDALSREYRIEANRVAKMLQEKSPDKINLENYNTIVSVNEYHPEDICNEDYLICEANGTLYRIVYHANSNNHILIYTNIAIIIMITCTIIILVYVQRKILRPFQNISHLAYELAKGNLSIPIKEEKSRLFGKFLWGMDMLREKLESDRQKELEFQKEKKTLLLSLSHDIKTPLSAIELYAKALSANLYETAEEKSKVTKGIIRNVDEIKRYVNEIANASREDFLNLTTCNDEFYLSEIINDIVNYYKDKLQLLHTNLIVKSFEDCLLYADKYRLIEVLQNIMENAIKYGDGKEITITFSEEENCRLIQIENTGNSLNEEELQNIFDSFYKGSNSTKNKGNGLGLYISKSLMKKMDGDIFAVIKNSRFCITVVVRKV